MFKSQRLSYKVGWDHCLYRPHTNFSLLRCVEWQQVCQYYHSSNAETQRIAVSMLKFDSSNAETQRLAVYMLQLPLFEC